MHSTDAAPAPLRSWLLVVALAAVAAAALGIPVRATYGAQTTADEPQYLLSALSIYEDASLDIADELRAERWRDFHEAQLPEQTKPLSDGRRVSPHDPLLPLYLAVPVGLGGWVAAKAALTLFAGAVAALTCWIAVRRFGVRPAVAGVIVGLFAMSAPLAPYGTQVYPELPAALCVLGAFAALTGDLRRRSLWVITACVVALPWLAIKYAPVAAVIAVHALWRLRREQRAGAMAGVAVACAAAGAAFVGIHLVVWEGLTSYASGDHFVGGEFTAVGGSPNYLGRARRVIGLLVDREFGLAAWQPAWLLAVPAGALLVRRQTAHRTVLLTILLAGWLNATFVALTMHGYWFPGRQVVVVLPLAVIAIAVAADRDRRIFFATLVAGVLGVWSYGWLVAAGWRRSITWVVDFYGVADPWYSAWSSLLPAYRYASTAMDVRHTLWSIAAVASVLLALGLHRRGRTARGG